MNKYECWISEQRDTTLKTVEAESSFAARQIYARENETVYIKVAARRIREPVVQS